MLVLLPCICLLECFQFAFPLLQALRIIMKTVFIVVHAFGA